MNTTPNPNAPQVPSALKPNANATPAPAAAPTPKASVVNTLPANSKAENGPMKVLAECQELAAKKAADYQNSNSSIKQADYYINGSQTIYDFMHTKMLRIRSLVEAEQAAKARGETFTQNNESIEDSAKDLINYATFLVAWNRGEIDGQ